MRSHGEADRIRRVEHGHRHRGHAGHELFVIYAYALFFDALELDRQLFDVRYGAVGKTLERCRTEQALPLTGLHVGEKQLAAGGAMQRGRVPTGSCMR